MAVLLPEGKQSFTTNGSLPLAGGKVYTYVPGTSTPKDTYTTESGSVANTNPVILDSRGEATIFWSGAYDVILKTSADVTIWGPIRHETPEISGSAAAVLADLANPSDAAKGDALVVVKRTESGAVATTQHIVNQQRHIFPVADFACAGDGTTDDTTKLNAALSCGANVIDGGGLTYKTTSALTVPAGVRFQNFTIQMADSNYNGLVLSDHSEVYGRVIGTSRVNQYPSAQVGVYAQSKSRIVGIIRVSNTNTGVNLESCTDCDIVAHCDAMSGQSGVSEGYGVLLNLSSNFNRIAVFAKQVARHALYVSSGSSFNTCVCHSEGTVTNFSVQINTRRDQAICTGNVITGNDYGSAGGVVLAMDTTASADAGGALQNNTIRDFEVVGLAAASGIYVANLYSAYLLTISTIGATLPSGNKFLNCSARGTFNSTSLGVVHVGGAAEDTTLRDINIRAVSANTGGSLVIDSVTGVTTLKGIDIDLLTSGAGVIGAYFNVASPNYFRFDDVQIICPSGTKVFYSGSSAAQRIGDGNSFVSNVSVTAIGATTSKTATINVPVYLQGSYTVQALITSESVSANPNSDVKVTSKGSTSFVLSVYNGHSAQQDITVDYRIVGLPA